MPTNDHDPGVVSRPDASTTDRRSENVDAAPENVSLVHVGESKAVLGPADSPEVGTTVCNALVKSSGQLAPWIDLDAIVAHLRTVEAETQAPYEEKLFALFVPIPSGDIQQPGRCRNCGSKADGTWCVPCAKVLN